jgi:hypothetical protein
VANKKEKEVQEEQEEQPVVQPATIEIPQIAIDKLETGGFNSDRVRLLVYGESGSGKTVFSSTWPKPLFIDIDDGMASVTRAVDRVAISTWGDIYDVYAWLTNVEHGYQTIVIDSLNEAQYISMQNTLDQFPNIARSYNSLPSMSDYGKMLSDFENMIRAFKALPTNLVLIAQVDKREFGTDTVGPQLTGKQSPRAVARMMDVIGFLYKAEGQAQERVMAFDAIDFVTKDRSGKLPQTVEKPTWEVLYRYWTA